MKKNVEVPEITKASSRGQIVIPTSIRNKMRLKEGSVFAVSSERDMIVLRKLDTGMKPGDLRTLKFLEEAWKGIEGGKYKKRPVGKFLEEIKKW